jgi:hypothetical protein
MADFVGWHITHLKKNGFFADCTNCKDKIDWTDVIAWTPLPEPNKETE